MTFKEDLTIKLTDSLEFVDLFHSKKSGNKKYPHTIIAVDSSKPNLGFNQDALNIINQCVDDILDLKISKYGPLYVYYNHNRVKELLIKIIIYAKLDSDKNKYNLIFKKIEQFFKDIKIHPYLCYLKIGNLKTSTVYDFKSFKFFPNNEKYLDEIFDLSKKPKEHFFWDIPKDSEKFSTIMELRVYAIDPNQAAEKALNSATDFLNAFKIFGAKALYYEGQIRLQYHDVYIVNNNTKIESRISQLEKYFIMDDIFDMDDFADSNPKLISKLQKVFNYENSSSLEKKSVNSLIWYGESIYEPNYSHRLLKMIIAIESLLLDDDDRGTKSYLLEERVAFLISESTEVRFLFADTINEAYRVRNSIVHNGEKKPISIRLIKYLMLIVHEINLKLLLSDQYQDLKDIKREVRMKKYQ